MFDPLGNGGVVYMCPEFALMRLEQLQQLHLEEFKANRKELGRQPIDAKFFSFDTSCEDSI